MPKMRRVSYAVCHPPEGVRRVMATIRDDLHAAVMVLDSDPETLLTASRIALEEGLDALVRPRRRTLSCRRSPTT